MRPPQKILAIVDPTATEQSALDKAALWAKKFGAKLEVFACDVESQAMSMFPTYIADSAPRRAVAQDRGERHGLSCEGYTPSR